MVEFTVTAYDSASPNPQIVFNPAYDHLVSFTLAATDGFAQLSLSPSTKLVNGQTKFLTPLTSYKFTGLENGVGTFYAVLGVASPYSGGSYTPNQQIQVSDAALTSNPYTTSIFAVVPGNVYQLPVAITGGLTSGAISAGNVMTFTVTGEDAYNNVVTTYGNGVTFGLTSTDSYSQFSLSSTTNTVPPAALRPSRVRSQAIRSRPDRSATTACKPSTP